MSLIPVNPFQRVQVTMGASLFDPRVLPGLELYLDSRLGLSSVADGATVQPWPDQSGHGRDAGNDTSNGNSGKMTMARSGAGLSPNGQPTVFFNGLDFPNAAVGLDALPNPWPSVSNGYTFYFGMNALAAVSSTGFSLMWNEGTANFRFNSDTVSGTGYYRDQAGQDRNANESAPAGWQSSRCVIHAAGMMDGYLNGQVMTWKAGWNQQWTITPNALAGYTLGNLATNYVLGTHGYFGWVLWYSREHSLATQRLVDNFMRGRFGLAPA